MRGRFQRSFFERYTPSVAKELLGSVLVRVAEEVLSGMVVEVEAYRGREDPASHAYRGLTRRNEVMFGEAGKAYVYFVFGNHYCLNVTTEKEGRAGAILIRALEPIAGIGCMMRNRAVEKLEELTSGPGKLTKAMKIDQKLNGEDLISSERLYLLRCSGKRFRIGRSQRIGIKKGVEFRWRYFIEGNRFVSKARPSEARLEKANLTENA